MESTNYDQFSASELESNSGRKMILQRVRRGKVAYLLYSVLVFVLLILLLITGIKFSQINRELAEVQLKLESLKKHVMGEEVTLAPPYATYGYYDPYDYELPVRGPCEEGWTFYHSSCYMISKEEVQWTSAVETCITLGAHLLVLNIAEELDYISKLLLSSKSYWIGLMRGEEDQWTWVDGTDFQSTPKFWDQGQPDNWDYRLNGEDCGQLHHASADPRRKLWNDADCTLAFQYICEAKRK